VILVEKCQRECIKSPLKDQQQMVTWSKKMENQIYIHPSMMTLCGLTFMCPAIVDHEYVLLSVPDTRLPITNVTVSEWTAQNILNKKPGQFVAICALDSFDLAAKEVHIRLV